jgi:hypothetical protein
MELTLDAQKNNILIELLYQNITQIKIAGTTIYETQQVVRIKLNDPKHLTDLLKDLEKDEYAERVQITDTKYSYRITAKGITFINTGGYKTPNKYLKWLSEPDNLWKIVTVVLTATVSLIIAFYKRGN